MSQPNTHLVGFLRELKRRRVYRVAVVYATVAFVILEGCSFIFPALLLPDWTFRLLVVLALVGLPIALVLAWAFEITPEGVRRTEPVTPDVGIRVARWVKAAALVAVTLVAAVGAYWGFLRPESPEVRQKQLVVVAPFVNQTGDRHLDLLGYQATEWITQGLAQTQLVMVVPFENAFIASRTVQTAGIPFSGTEAIEAFAEETAADIVVTGSFYQQGDEILLQARVSDASTGEVRFGLEPISASAGAPRTGIEALSDQVMVAMAASLNPDWTLEPVDLDLLSRPQSFEAYSEYLAGLEAHFIDGDWQAAVAHFDSAAALDTTWLWPTLNTAYPYGNMGELAKAESVAYLINSQRNRLTQLERLVVDELIAYLKGDLYGTLQVLRRGAEIMPGQITSHGKLGQALVDVNHPQEAVTVLNRVRGRIWGWEFGPLVKALHMLGEYRTELDEVRRERRDDPDWPDGLRYEAQALAALGRIEDVRRLIDESLNIPSQGRFTPGYAMLNTGLELRTHGHPSEAHEMFERAVAWYQRDLQENTGTPVHREHRALLGRALYAAGRWDEAEELYQHLLSEFPEEFDLPQWFPGGTIEYQGYLGVLAARRGDRERALEISEMLSELERPRLQGRHVYWRACIAAVLGERERAVELLRDAFGLGWGYWNTDAGMNGDRHSDINLESLRDYRPFQELMRPKG